MLAADSSRNTMETTEEKRDDTESAGESINESEEHRSLKYQLLGPSLTKAGQDEVDQRKVGVERSLHVFRGLLGLSEAGIGDHI